MTITVICSVADMATVNATLESGGWGPENFSVPIYGGSYRASHAALKNVEGLAEWKR